MSDTKRFATIRAVRAAVDGGRIYERGTAEEIAVKAILDLPVGTFADEPRGTVPVRTGLLERLWRYSGQFDEPGAAVCHPNAAMANACGDGARAIYRLFLVIDDLVDVLRPLVEGEKCDHGAGICWCPVHRALEEARDARAAAGAPVQS